MYPIRFEPIIQDYVWGGDRISRKYHRSQKGRIAESWEISDRDDAMSVVANGSYKGRTLRDLMRELGEKLYGHGKKYDRFPLLLKIIDAKENLSLQVHPNERTAAELKGEPKTEMWVALEPSCVYAGLKKGMGQAELLKALKANHLDDVLEKVDLKPREAIYLPGGRIHAICGGSLLYEVQQNSDTTYRLYDWGRTTRPLHLKEALVAIEWGDQKGAKLTPRHLESDMEHQLISLVSSPHFVVLRIDVFKYWQATPTAHSFQVFFCLEGEGHIIVDEYKEPFQAGSTYLIPADSNSIRIEGKCEALWIRAE
ncbi:MAG TPA: type I phosphomannose isomerase catalytic subunit [Chlamydiales bacterium]|nr:type I phosphomannose isomerase catalytic subunit [Chlamydiales bacterium]